MILEERKKEFYDAIKEKVGEKLTDEQIRGIVEKFNLENGNIPQIITTTNPYDFEKSSRRNKDIFEHSWAGSRKDITETDVLIGDYKPGIDDIYEYSENGNTSEPQESHEMSDFSINQVQVAVVMESTIDDFNGNNIDEYNESVQIYLPEEKEYPENVSFKQMVLEERKTKFYKAIKEKVGEKLTDEQIRGIVEKFNLENGNIPQIITTTNPYDFEKSSRRNKDIFEHSWAGSRKDITETDVLIGDYKPGIDDIYEYSENGNTSEPQESHEMSDFSINQVQVAVVMESTIDDFNGNNIDEYNESVQIYLPEEKEYPKNVSFKQMIAENSKYDFEKSVVLLNKAIDLNNKAKNIKDLQEAADYFLKNCYNVGINYENR